MSSFFWDDPDLTLIFRGDLLESGSWPNIAVHLAELYRAQKDRFVSGLRGSFAIIVYDHNDHALKAWIDHFGIERLVFAQHGESVAVGTNIRSVCQIYQGPPIISPAAIHEYLQYTCVPSPKTIYQNISKVPPGHQLISRPAVMTRPYWDMVYNERDDSHRSEGVWAQETRNGVRSAVALNLKYSAEPFKPGCFLSGGTDSSTVAGFVGSLTERPPRTFSIGFDDARYNEIEYARIAAKHFVAEHHEYFVKPDDIPTLVQKAVQVYDEPFGNSSIVPTYYCARLAAEHGITHLLAGDGGDELFGGNARYTADRVFQRYGFIPPRMRRLFLEPVVSCTAQLTNLRGVNLAAKYVRRSNLPVPDRYFSYSWIYEVSPNQLFTPDFIAAIHGHDSMETAQNHFYSAPADNDLNRWLYLDLKITIADNDLRKVTEMSRLAGVTPRFPFLDPTLAEFTGKIPYKLKVRGSQLRYLFKKAMQGLLPPEILRKTKHGFGLPYAVWLGDSKPLRDFTFDVLRSARCRQRGYFRSGLVDTIWSQYQSESRAYYGEILWMLLMLELWHVMHAEVSRPALRRMAAAPQLN